MKRKRSTSRRSRRVASKQSRGGGFFSSNIGRGVKTGLALAAVIGVGAGINAIVRPQSKLVGAAIYAGVGLVGAGLGGLASKKLKAPLMAAGVGMGVVTLLADQVAMLTQKTSGQLAGVSGGVLPASQFSQQAPATPQQSFAPVQTVSAPRQTTFQQIAGVAADLGPAVAGIISALRQPAPVAAAAGINDWDAQGAQGINDWNAQGAGNYWARY